jgi:hypothetical protein
LKPFVDEIVSFYENKCNAQEGEAHIELLDDLGATKLYKFVLDKIITDVPAKSFILSTSYLFCLISPARKLNFTNIY